MPGHNPHVPIWANFVVFGPILKISNAICISNGYLAFSDPDDRLGMPGQPSMPRHDPHVPIWANFVVYEPILKISNSIGNLIFLPKWPNRHARALPSMPGHMPRA